MLFGYFVFQGTTYIKQIQLNASLEKKIEELLALQSNDFLMDGSELLEIREFYPGDPSSDTYISKIEYDDPDGLVEAVSNPLLVPFMTPENDLQNIVAVFSKSLSNPSDVLIQLIDHKHTILPKSGWLTFKKIFDGNLNQAKNLLLDSNSNGTFVEMDDLGLQLDNKLTAILRNGNLLFKSYYQLNRIFDLGDYLTAATNETVNEFLSLDIISSKGNPKAFVNTWSHAQRRRVSKVMALGFVNKFSGTEILQRAKRAKKPISIELDDGKIVIPEKTSELAGLLQFLSNGVMASYLDDECDYEVGSMRPLK